MDKIKDSNVLEDCLIRYKAKKYRVEREGNIFDIAFEDIEWTINCPIFGIELDYYNGVRKSNSPSFWLKNPSLGFVKGNVQIVSSKAKKILGISSPDDLRIVFNYLKSIDII